MANLGLKNGIYHVRFRFDREYKKSLKTRDKTDAEAAVRSVEQTIHRLLIGLITIPSGVDPGDFIVSGGTLLQPASTIEPVQQPDRRGISCLMFSSSPLPNRGRPQVHARPGPLQ